MQIIDPDRALRADAWRQEPSSYPFHDSFKPRFSDVDALQHLNNVALIGFHQEACQRLLLEILGERSWRAGEPLIATLCSSTEYLGEAFYPDTLQAAAGLSQVDHQGFTISSALFQRGHCVGLHLARYGCWQAGQRSALPGHLLALLDAAVAAATTATTATTATAATAATVSAAEGLATGGQPEALAPLIEVDAPAAQHFPWREPLRSRFSDREARDVLGDLPLARYAECLRTDMFHSALRDLPPGARGRTVVARVDLAFAQRTRPPLEWQGAAAVTRIGGRSLSVRCLLEAGTGCQAVCDAVLVIGTGGGRGSGANGGGNGIGNGSGGIVGPLRAALERLRLS